MVKFTNITELFEVFLIENSYYDLFLKNLKEHTNYKTINDFVNSELNSINKDDCIDQEFRRLINRAFNWSRSTQGMHYWYIVSMSWCYFYDSNKNNIINKTTLVPADDKKFVSLW